MANRRPKPRSPAKKPEAQGSPGLVLAHYGQTSLVESEAGEVIRCVTRKNLPRTVCGDRILWTSSNPREGVITRVLDRNSTLVRPDHNNRPRPVAANMDQIVVVIASKPSFEYGMLDRYLAASELIGVTPVIVVNKCDLLDSESRERLEQRLSLYRDVGYTLLFTSTLSTDGMKDLYAALKNHTSILVGQSGVGKSSLVQTLLPDLEIRVGNLSQVTGLGRHTTTVATLYHLPDGGDLIDSPGVRDFTLCNVGPEELAQGFREFAPWLGQCRFHNCRHVSEPSCAIADAARSGNIHPQRLENYRALAASLKAQG
ncbi:Ribosome small subunit biogenesis RbfA-release protein RsgA [hydrothermal vent metagenome]|uniref:Ribosome small subunit biogenesis RbfA-release protein RsgA n=1 Tax=hydrothermal vent metagenome TaxID=652676 RepID=A0A3B0Y7J0_9ZZZZ